jgi:hypothetical protein
MAGELDAVKAAAARVTNVKDSVVTFIRGLKTALDAAIAANDPVALNEISVALGQDADEIAAAIQQNTPVSAAK